MPQRLRPLLSLMIKAAISALLLYLSLRRVEMATVAERLNRIDFSWLAVVVAILMFQVGMLAIRWRQILLVCGASVSAFKTLQMSLIASFFNQTLPSTIGGDAARVWMVARHAMSWTIAAYSVLIDRAVGLFALALIVVGCLPWTLDLVRDPVARAALIVIGLAGIAGPVVFVAIGFIGRAWLNRWWATRHVPAVAAIIRRICTSARNAALIASLSLLIHALSVAAVWAAAKAVAAPFDFILALSIVPPVILVATIPISIAGWGVRESAMIAAFSYAGLAQSDGLIVSLIFGGATFIVGAIGGLVWIASGERPAANAANALQERR